MSQLEQVREHLESGRTLTAMAALREYGIGRLAPKIHLLRKEGYQIKTEVQKSGRKHWAAYCLEGEQSSEQNNRSGDQGDN